MVALSNVGNKYLAAKETTYGETPSPFTSEDMGHIQSININEEENVEKLSSMNSGHTAARFEDGLYWANVSIETRATKASLPNLLEICLGSLTEATDYTVNSSLDQISHSFKVSYTDTKILLINGLSVKDFTIEVSKGEIKSFTINCLARLVQSQTETISPTTNTDKIFNWTDCYVSVGGTNYVLENFSIEGNWNVTDDEGRGIEQMSNGERRLINRVIKHQLDLSGTYEMEVSNDSEIGYQDERTDEEIKFTVSRGTDNEHVYTMANTRSSTREYEPSTDNSKRMITYNYEALDLEVTGDLPA